MPTPSRGLPPKPPVTLAPAQEPSSLIRRPSSGVWGPRAHSIIRRSRSRSSSDVASSGYAESSAALSRTGGESSIAPSKVGGGGGRDGGGGVGGGGGGGEEEGGHGSYGGRYGFALRSYDLVNKPRPYRELAADVVQKGASMPKKKVVPILRELCIRIGDNSVCDGAFFGALLAVLRSAKDGDWDGKAVRLVHFFVRGMVTTQGDTDGRMLGSNWEGRGITSRQILQAIECFREESEHRLAVRRIPAFQTMAILCQLAAEAGVGGQPPPVEVLREATMTPLRSFQAQERPEHGGKGRSHRQRLEAFQDSLRISSNVFSAVRRCPALARDVTILPTVLQGCCSENPLAARHSFAVLAEQATESPTVVSEALLSKAMLLPTTVGMLQAPEGVGSAGDEPNLRDSLACVYYLRALKALAFSEKLDDTMRLDMYRIMVSSVSDARHRVALEAMQCLLDHPRAWELLVDAQRESRDADIFRRVVDRIKLCVEEATAPAAAAAAAGASITAGAPEAPAVAAADRISKKIGKGAVGGVGGAADGASAGGDGAQCNWALAHAACRVCRVVGRTFQVAISYQTIQSQNREHSTTNHRGGGVGSTTVSSTTGAPTPAHGLGPRPPSMRADPGWEGFGGGSMSMDAEQTTGRGAGAMGAASSLDQSAGASAFNLLGLPPTPPTRSGVSGASVWSGAAAWGDEGSGDVMAGQVVEEQNTAAIRDLCRALQQHKLLESPHLHVRSLALEAMFLLVPDPSPLDPQLRGLWDWLQLRVQQCPSTLPDSVLSELVDTLLTRVHCSAASREEVIPIALSLTESFMYQVPSDEMGRCVLRAWCQCVGYGGRSREAVLQSVYRLLDRNITLSPDTPDALALAGKIGTVGEAGTAGSFGKAIAGRKPRHLRGAPSEDWTRLTLPSQLYTDEIAPTDTGGGASGSLGVPAPTTTATLSTPTRDVSGKGDADATAGAYTWDGGSILGGEEASRWETLGGADAIDSYLPLRVSCLRSRGAATRLKRSAYWFLGEYCRQLTGVLPQPSTTNDEKSDTIWPGFLQHGKSPRARQQTAGSDLLGSWSADAVGAGIPGGGLEGVEGGAGSAPRAYPHPIVAAMNGATVSILLRLKHAAMFEDFQTRHTCVSALCKIALRLPHPVRFDVFCFLKGLADVADVFPLVKHGGRGYAAHGGGNGEGSLKGYWQEQEELAERIETAGAFGVGDVITPVLDYLDCVYAVACDADPAAHDGRGKDDARPLESSPLAATSLLKMEGVPADAGMGAASMDVYRRLLDSGQGAAPGA